MEFKPEDFVFHVDELMNLTSEVICRVANARLRQMLEAAPVIFLREAGGITDNFIEADDRYDRTHTARLIEIEEIK